LGYGESPGRSLRVFVLLLAPVSLEVGLIYLSFPFRRGLSLIFFITLTPGLFFFSCWWDLYPSPTIWWLLTPVFVSSLLNPPPKRARSVCSTSLPGSSPFRFHIFSNPSRREMSHLELRRLCFFRPSPVPARAWVFLAVPFYLCLSTPCFLWLSFSQGSVHTTSRYSFLLSAF